MLKKMKHKMWGITKLLCLFFVTNNYPYSSLQEFEDCIVPVLDTQGMEWRNDWHYISYLCMNENDNSLCFRTYPFTTINNSGFYKLASDVVNQITITVPNVTLDLNGNTVSGGAHGIVINSDLTNITIKNGTITNTIDGIQVNSGCSDITLLNLASKNCVRGIACTQIADAVIRNCDLISNTTGIEIDASYNVYMQHCVAQSNVQAGYSLISSNTCTLQDCKALATGEGNASIFGDTSNVFGFVSSNGYGNVFERCIANATQALTTTDSNSVVAGFGLKGIEGCTKIINCEAADSMTSPDGVTVPYGIWLEPQFDGLISVTAALPRNESERLFAVSWSPDGQYLAVGGRMATGGPLNDLLIYKFDRVLGVLTEVAAVNEGASLDIAQAISWSPDGQYLAVGGEYTNGDDLLIYRFDNVTETLTRIASSNPDGGSGTDIILSVDWSPDGTYLAVGGTVGDTTGNDLFVYKFDRVLYTLTVVAMSNPDEGSSSDEVDTVKWSPDGQYLAVGGEINGSTNNDLFIYSFNKTTEALAQIISLDPGGITSNIVYSVDWSSDGQYLAVGIDSSGGSAEDLFVYRFNKTDQTLTEVASINPDVAFSDSIRTVVWSPDDKYLAVGGNINGSTGNDVFVYNFDRSNETLIEVDSLNPQSPQDIGDLIKSLSWSPDGGYLAIAPGLVGVPPNPVFIYQAYVFPSNNVITNNTVYCNVGNQYPGGVGISGSSIANIMINNTAFNNPFNYQFVCNVFDQLFGEGPSLMQNIAVEPDVPIITPDDIPTRIKRTQLLLESLIDNLL